MAREDGGLPMVSFWGIWNDGPESEIPPGMIGAQATHCENPRCTNNNCAAVAIALTSGGEIIQLRMEPDAAREFAAIVLAAANAAAPAMKVGAN